MTSVSLKRNILMIIVVGGKEVGKTWLVEQFLNVRHNNSNQHHVPISDGFFIKEQKIGDESVTLQIFESPKEELLYNGAHGCVLVYDVNNQESFEALEKLHEEFLQKAKPAYKGSFPFLMIGNKAESESERAVSKDVALKWCAKKGNIPYFETSLAQDTNVNDAFNCIVDNAWAWNVNRHERQKLYQKQMNFRLGYAATLSTITMGLLGYVGIHPRSYHGFHITFMITGLTVASTFLIGCMLYGVYSRSRDDPGEQYFIRSLNIALFSTAHAALVMSVVIGFCPLHFIFWFVIALCGFCVVHIAFSFSRYTYSFSGTYSCFCSCTTSDLSCTCLPKWCPSFRYFYYGF